MKQLSILQTNISEILSEEMKTFLRVSNEEHITEILSYYFDLGGKRIRPTIFYAVSKAFNSQENLAPFSLVLELIHTMSLYHDDVLDNADERRGAPTVHHKWDKATAIVGGDIFHGLIHNHIFESIKSGNVKNEKRGIKFLSDLITQVELPIGTAVLLEMKLADSEQIPNMDKVIKVAQGKTAPLFAFSASAAANLAGKNNDISIKLFEMGMKLGLAFQLLDDIGDYYPSNKGFGRDLKDDRKTPILVQCHLDNPDLLKQFRDKRSVLSEEDIHEFRSSFAESFVKVIDLSKQYLDQALLDLDIIPDNEYRSTLLVLVDMLQKRCIDMRNNLSSN